MSEELLRYSRIDDHMKREFLLLQGKGCVWGKCTFCDYYDDVSAEPFVVNKPVLDQITGDYGVVDVINSGSIFELDEKSKNYLKEKLLEKQVKTLWCESHWLYRNRLDEIRAFFAPVQVKFRIGAETFDKTVRKAWNKGIEETVTAEEIGQYFDGACLLVCVKGQTKDMILRDIQLAWENFEYFNINVFIENSTVEKCDTKLATWFAKDIAPKLADYENIEVLLNNTDLGVG